jgi:hypothetical protein
MTVKNNVLIGKKGRLFLFQGGHSQFDYLTNVKTISKKNIENFSENIKERQQFCKNKKIIYKHIVFPSKPLVQTSHLPRSYHKKVNSLFNRYYKNKLDDETKKSLFYPLESLKELDKTYSSFKKYDTHMTDRACYLIASELMGFLGFSLNDYPYEVDKRLESGDLGYMINSSDKNEEELVFLKSSHVYRTSNMRHISGNSNSIYLTHAPKGRTKFRLLIFGDSFFKDLIKYLEPFFIDIMYVRSSTMQYDIIALYKPDVIFTGNAERYLFHIDSDKEDTGFLWNLYGNKNYHPPQEFINALTANLSFHFHNFAYNQWKNSIKKYFIQSLELDSYIINKDMDIIESSHYLKFISTGIDPYIIYMNIGFKKEKTYSLKVNLISSVDTAFQVFYTDRRINPHEFSEKNSVRHLIKKGNNKMDIILDYKYLGNVLRIDPMSREGEMDIVSLSLEERENNSDIVEKKGF